MKKILIFQLSIFIFISAQTWAGNSQQNNADWNKLSPTDQPSPIITMRDPFSEPQIMSTNNQHGSSFSRSNSMNSFGMGFQRSRADIKVPQLIFKGFIDRGEEKSPMALIQIGNNRVHMVREGDEINIDPSQPRQAIRITKISRLSITVETGTLGTMKVLR